MAFGVPGTGLFPMDLGFPLVLTLLLGSIWWPVGYYLGRSGNSFNELNAYFVFVFLSVSV